MENTEITVQTNFFKDDSLYEIINKIMEKDYHSLVEWIISYHYPENTRTLASCFEMDFLVLKKSISPLLKKYKKLLRWSRLEEAYNLFRTGVFSIIDSFRAKYLFLEKYIPGLFSVFYEIVERKNVSCEADLIKIKESLQKIEKETDSPDLEKYGEEKADYEKKLADHMILLQELITLLIEEYNRRITATRQNFEEFIVSHKEQVKKINADMDLAREKIQALKEDKAIPDDEKKNLLEAFKKKHNELAAILHSENNRMSTLKTLSENIQKGFAYLEDLITSLQEQRMQFKKRKEYLESLTRIGKDIPDVRSSLESLSASLGKNFPEFKKNFMVCDRELQRKILHAIESQEVINRIVFSDKNTISEEMKINFPTSEKEPGVITPEPIGDIDLNIFHHIPKESGDSP